MREQSTGRTSVGSARYHFDARSIHAMRDQWKRRIGFVRYHECLPQCLAAALDAGTVAREDGRQRLTLFHPITGSSGDHEADARVDTVVHLRAAATQSDDAAPDGPRLHASDEAAARCAEQLAFRRLREHGGIVDDARVSALRFDDLLKVLGGLPGADRLLHLSARAITALGGTRQRQHLRAEGVGDLEQIGWPLTFEGVNRLLHFERVAARPA